jgi:hypothetical protein
MLSFFIVSRTPSCDPPPSARKRLQHLSRFLNLNLWCPRLRWIFSTWQLALVRIASMKPALLSGGIRLDSSDTIRLTNIPSSTLTVDPHLGTQWYHSSPMQGHSNWKLGQGAGTFAVSLRVSSACFLEWRSLADNQLLE